MGSSDDRAPDCSGRGPGFESGIPPWWRSSNTERGNVQAPVTDMGKCCTDLGRGGVSLLRECSTKTAVKAGRWTIGHMQLEELSSDQMTTANEDG